eukprot:178178_1
MTSKNCPSSAVDELKWFEGNKICVDNSYNRWDGEYEWISLFSSRNQSVYKHTESNKYIYEIKNSNSPGYIYYFSDYEINYIMTTRCIINNIFDVSECNGLWETYYAQYNETWLSDYIIVTKCNDICTFNNKALINMDAALNPNTFTWNYFRRGSTTGYTNIYRCDQCAGDKSDTVNLYLYGRKETTDNSYWWLISQSTWSGPEDENTKNRCFLGYNLSDNNSVWHSDTFIYPSNCSTPGSWQSFVNNTWIVDYNMTLSECISHRHYQYNTLPVEAGLQQSEICVANTGTILRNYLKWSGVYKWLFYDKFTNLSAYYNVHNNIYIYPEIYLGNVQYGIYTKMSEDQYLVWYYKKNIPIKPTHFLQGKCHMNTTNIDISYCNGRWDLYTLSGIRTTKDSIMQTTPCQNNFVYNPILNKYNEVCVEIGEESNIYRSYRMKRGHQNLAVGFDLNVMHNHGNYSFIIEYVCHFIDAMFSGFSTIDQLEYPALNIIRNLSPVCNNASSVDIKFASSINTIAYVNNLYLFYNSSNALFFEYNDDNSVFNNVISELPPIRNECVVEHLFDIVISDENVFI